MEHLDDATVVALLDPTEMTDTLERVFAEWGAGDAASTVRVRATAGGGMASAMAAVVPSLGVSGGKVYATKDGRFTFHVVLFDLDGTLIATLDGASITTVRTPALCGVAIRRLAPARVDSAAVLGTGIEALPHLEMLARELPGAELVVWGRDPDKASALAARAGHVGVDASVADSSNDAVARSQVVVTVTSANEPLFDPDALGPNTLICGVGATKPERCELAPELFRRAAAVVTDSAAGSPAECGDLIRAVAVGAFDWSTLVDLRDVLAGNVEVPRAGAIGPVIFESQGVAIQDVAAAALVLEHHGRRR